MSRASGRRWLARIAVGVLITTLPVTAGEVRLVWNPSTGATGYRVHYGSSSGNLPQTVTLGNTSQAQITGLTDCAVTYFAVSAFNSAGESGNSNEVSSWPRPVVSTLSISSAEQGQSLAIAVSGVNFRSGATVTFSGSGVTVSSATISSCNQMTLNVSVSGSAAVGARDLLVTNPEGVTGTATGAFTVVAAVGPSVTATNPANGATAVPITVHPSVTFSEPVLASTVTTATVHLLNPSGTPVPQAAGSPSLSADGRIATIVPAASLISGTTYRIEVIGGASGVRDLANLPMAATFVQPNGFVAGGSPDTTPPSVPQGLQGTALGPTQVQLTWNASTDTGGSGLGGYRVFRNGTSIATTTATSYVVGQLSAATTYAFSVAAYDNATPANESAASPAVNVTTAAAPTVVARINAGGASFTDDQGGQWSADTGYNTGSISSTASAISGTVNDALYQTERWDPNDATELEYALPVTNGTYTVNLHFAEIYSGSFSVGARIFDVQVEGQLVVDNLDIFAEAGGNAALVKTVQANVADGQLNIRFLHVAQNPKVSAIEVLGQPAAPDTQAPTVPQGLQANAAGPTVVALSWSASTDLGGGVVAGYRIFRNGVSIATTTATTYSDPGVQPSTQYSYSVAAYDNATPANESVPSSPVSVTTPANAQPLPPVPNLRRTDKR